MNATAQTLDYRSILRRELESRCRRNPRYSLRSFARDLAISPSRLSDVLRGRYGLSRTAAESIAVKLGWSTSEREFFCDQVESEHARSRKSRLQAQHRLSQQSQIPAHQQLTLDAFQVISDWHHYAILELTLVKNFRSDVTWIARQLGVSEHLVTAAIARMKRLELIEEGKDGRLRACDAFTASPSGVPSEAIRKFHRQILEKALAALEFQSVDERDFSSMVLAVNKAQVPEAVEDIKKFRRGFDAKFGKAQKKDEVYCLAVQFFRLQEKTTGREK